MRALIFTYGLAYGGAVVSLFNPYVGLLIYICFAIIKPDSLWFWSVPEGNYSRVVAIGLLTGWILNGFGNWRFGRGVTIVVAAIGYFFWCIVSSLVASDQKAAWDFTESISKIILPVVIGATLINSTHRLKQLAWVITLSEGYLAWEFNLSYFELGALNNRLNAMGFAGMEEKSVAVGMVTTAGLAFFLGIESKHWWTKATSLLLTALMMHVPLFTMTRGGMIAMIATAVVSFLMLRKQWMHYLIFILAIALSLQLAGPEVRKFFLTSFEPKQNQDRSAQHRLEHWKFCGTIIADYPLIGIGPRHYPMYYHAHKGYQMEAHQTWLQLAAEVGIPGLLMLALFMGMPVVLLWPVVRGKIFIDEPELRGIACGIIAGIVGFCAASQFITLYYVEQPFYVILTGIGLVKVILRRDIVTGQIATSPVETSAASRSTYYAIGRLKNPVF